LMQFFASCKAQPVGNDGGVKSLKRGWLGGEVAVT